jgi:hypothetical protein
LGLEKPNSGLDPGETNSGSDLDSDETFQISRNLGLDIDKIVCLLDSQLWKRPTLFVVFLFGSNATLPPSAMHHSTFPTSVLLFLLSVEQNVQLSYIN